MTENTITAHKIPQGQKIKPETVKHSFDLIFDDTAWKIYLLKWKRSKTTLLLKAMNWYIGDVELKISIKNRCKNSGSGMLFSMNSKKNCFNIEIYATSSWFNEFKQDVNGSSRRPTWASKRAKLLKYAQSFLKQNKLTNLSTEKPFVHR